VRDLNKVLLVCLIVFVFVCVLGYWVRRDFGFISGSSDYRFHELRAQGKCLPNSLDPNYCWNYPLAYAWLSGFFGNGMLSFWFFNALLFFVLLPLLLFFVSKSWVVSWFAISTISLPFYILFNGHFAQGLAVILFLIFLCFRGKPLLQLGTLFLALSVHGYAILLLGLAFLLELLLPVLKEFFEGNKSKLLACIPLTPSFSKASGINLPFTFNFNQFIVFLVKGMPFPIVFFGFKGLFMKRDWVLLFVSVVLILFSIFSFPQFFRNFLFLQPILLLGLGEYYSKASLTMKRGLLLFSFLVFFMQFLVFGLNLLESVKALCLS
jgi:hypothetical protein